jgi:hypothetical protein
MPQLNRAGKCQHAQNNSNQHGSRLRNEQDRPAVVSICDQSTDQGKRQYCQKTHTTHYTDGDRVFAELTDMPEQSPLLHL